MKVKPERETGMRIGELARETNVSTRLLRYYEQQALLRPTRGDNGYRQYAPADVVLVSRIRYLLAAGLPTSVIARILHCMHGDAAAPVPSGCPEMLKQLTHEQARVAGTIADLQATYDALAEALSSARAARAT